MKNKCLFMLFMVLFMIFPKLNVDAEVCDAADIQRLKELSKNITVDYKYLGDVNYDGNYQLYEVSFNFSGLDGDVYIQEFYGEEKVYNSSEKLYVDSGKRQFIIYSSDCVDMKIGYINVELPKFNEFSLDDDCQNQASELEVCDEWYQGKIDASVYNEIVNEYYEEIEELRDNKILKFFKENYLFVIIGGILFICLIILFIFRYRKRNRLD